MYLICHLHYVIYITLFILRYLYYITHLGYNKIISSDSFKLDEMITQPLLPCVLLSEYLYHITVRYSIE